MFAPKILKLETSSDGTVLLQAEVKTAPTLMFIFPCEAMSAYNYVGVIRSTTDGYKIRDWERRVSELVEESCEVDLSGFKDEAVRNMSALLYWK